MTATAPREQCGAIGHAPPILGGFQVTCGLEAGHDAPRPRHDWSRCAICGGTQCKGVANGSDHIFQPATIEWFREAHRFWVEWPS